MDLYRLLDDDVHGVNSEVKGSANHALFPEVNPTDQGTSHPLQRFCFSSKQKHLTKKLSHCAASPTFL